MLKESKKSTKIPTKKLSIVLLELREKITNKICKINKQMLYKKSKLLLKIRLYFLMSKNNNYRTI